MPSSQNEIEISDPIPLPTGAATEAKQDSEIALLTTLNGIVATQATQAAILARLHEQFNVSIGDGANLDAFSRLRVSNPVTLFESIQRYGDDLQKWETAVTGTGTSTFSAADASMMMSTGGTAIGASCTRMSRQHFRYQAGKSMLWFQTFCMGAHVTGVEMTVGASITNGTTTIQDGVNFRRDENGTLSFLITSSTSGSPVPDAYPQANWNIDTLDGSGDANNPSGILLDDTAPQILVYDLQYLAVGRVRVGFNIGGIIIYCHEFRHANDPAYPTIYMRTATLAAYLSVRNSGVTATPATLQHICTAVMAEGGSELGRVYQFTHNLGITPKAVTTRRPILSIRAKTTGPNAVRNTGMLIPTEFDLNTATQSALFEIVLNGTLTGAVWSDVNSSSSLAEKDSSATAISGGTIIHSGHVINGSGPTRGSFAKELAKDLALVYSSLGSVQDVFTIVCTAFTGTASVLAAVGWDEAGI